MPMRGKTPTPITWIRNEAGCIICTSHGASSCRSLRSKIGSRRGLSGPLNASCGHKLCINPAHLVKGKKKTGPKIKPVRWIVDGNGCFICTSHHRDSDGYPRKCVNGKGAAISRLICLERGAVGKFEALHSCDNPACINPDHISPGTTQRNTREREERGRGVKGSRVSQAKLNEKQAMEIFRSSGTLSSIARAYGVSTTVVSLIKRKQRWKHIHNCPCPF